jgi:hypothetical protein
MQRPNHKEMVITKLARCDQSGSGRFPPKTPNRAVNFSMIWGIGKKRKIFVLFRFGVDRLIQADSKIAIEGHKSGSPAKMASDAATTPNGPIG